MKPMDNITVRLSPALQPGMTRIHLSGVISTRLSNKDVRRLWWLIDQMSEAVCIALAVDAPLGWFDLWTLRTGWLQVSRLAIRFVQTRRSPAFGRKMAPPWAE